MAAQTRIVILGGGFAGVACARRLRKRLKPDEAEIHLFNRENHMVFHPLLAEVAGASINPDAAAAPLRQMLPGVRCRTEAVHQADPEHNRVRYEDPNGIERTLEYDHLVIACGGEVNLGMVPGMADHAFALKTIGDAMVLRAHIIEQLEKAEVEPDPDRRRWRLHFIVVGGGYSGVETAGEINDLVRESRKYYPSIQEDEYRVTLVHSHEQILPEISPPLREFAREKMEQRGIDFVLNTRALMATGDGIGLDDETKLFGATVVCTIGTTAAPLVRRLDTPKERDRLVTQADMRLKGMENIWAIGDCARIVNDYDGEASPPTGQFAERQGKQAAENIVRALQKKETHPFSFKPVGQLCSIGGRRAVAELMGLKLSGFIAWYLWRGVYLFKLPTWSRRAKVGFDWAWELVFSRDLMHLKTDTSENVSHAYFHPGDIVFREGDPASEFYIIESGEAEILRKGDDGDEELLAVLGPGDFFGEMALLSNQPRNASVRARTALECVVMGEMVFEQVSQALKPLRDVLAQAMQRRSGQTWQRMPQVRERLSEVEVRELAEPLEVRPLQLQTTFAQAIERFCEEPADFTCVVDDTGRLRGIVSRAEILTALEQGAERQTPVREIMIENPVAVYAHDSCLTAGETMRDHGLSYLPVLESVDNPVCERYLRAETLVNHALKRGASDE